MGGVLVEVDIVSGVTIHAATEHVQLLIPPPSKVASPAAGSVLVSILV